MSSSNAMAAKARAMYGERIKPADYSTLLQKKSVSDIAAFLKDTKLYGDTLEGINVKGIHRGQLEVLLRTDVYDRLVQLMRYADRSSKKFTMLAVQRTEINLIRLCVRSFEDDSNARDIMIAHMPLYLDESASFSMKDLANVHDFDSLLNLLKQTVYYVPLKHFYPDDDGKVNYAGLEHALNRVYYDSALELINQHSSGNEKKELLRILKSEAELENIAIIYRLKKYFNRTPNEIRTLVTRNYCLFKPYEIEQMIDQCDADEIVERLYKRYKPFLGDDEFTYIEHSIKVIRFNMNYRYLQFSTAPHTVLLSYFILSELEIQNLVEIVEGVKYGISQDRIRPLLVY